MAKLLDYSLLPLYPDCACGNTMLSTPFGISCANCKFFIDTIALRNCNTINEMIALIREESRKHAQSFYKK